MNSKGPNLLSESSETPSGDKGRILAVTGKGGTGKTMLATLIIKLLAQRGDLKILAVDADSAASLPYALGMKVGKTVGELRQEIIEDPEVKRKIADQHIRTGVATLLEPGPGFDLLVMGRPEAPGCFCAVNDLLRYGVEILAQDYHITIIDGEAGPEQVNRRVVGSIDHLLVVADTSIRSLQTAKEIMRVAQAHGNIGVGRTDLIVNRFSSERAAVKEAAQRMDLEILGYIPEDDNIARFDNLGKPLIDLPPDSPSLLAVRQILGRVL